MLFAPERSTLIGSRNESDGSSVLRIRSGEHDYCVRRGPSPTFEGLVSGPRRLTVRGLFAHCGGHGHGVFGLRALFPG